MRVIDTHAHLDFPEYEPDRTTLLTELARLEIGVINPATDKDSIAAIDRLTKANPLVWGAVGLHPTEVTTEMLTELPDLIKAWGGIIDTNPKIVAVGEIGLDYYHQRESATHQKAALRGMLTFANERALPVIFHCRDAYGDLVTLLEDYPGTRGVAHCFSGNRAQAEQFLGLGLFLSFTANITYPKNEAIRAIITEVPLEKIMIETDSPFLSPQDSRGERNDPRQAEIVAATIAELKKIPVEVVLEQTTATAQKLFNII